MKTKLTQRLISLLLAAVLMMAMIPMSASAAEWTNPFTDVKSTSWYYLGVKYMNRNGYIAGTTPTTFSPNQTTTRGMFVTILGRYVGIDPKEYEDKYSFDDHAPSWAKPYIAWATENGIVNGVGKNRFNANGNVTREQAVTILYNFLVANGYRPTVRETFRQYWTDSDKVSKYAVTPVMWACTAGILLGMNDSTGRICPGNNATRAQIVEIFTRFIKHRAILDGNFAFVIDEDEPDPNKNRTLINGEPITTAGIQKILLSLRDKYRHGDDWGGGTRPNVACEDFAATLQNEVFSGFDPDDAYYTNIFRPDQVRVGDFLCYVSGDEVHVILVLAKREDYYIAVEGNYAKKICWGRKLYPSNFEWCSVYSFYPQDWDPAKDVTSPELEAQIDEIADYFDTDESWAIFVG